MPGSRLAFAFTAFFLALTGTAAAQGEHPLVKPWQLNFQAPFSPVMERLYDTHTFLLWIITAICALVLALLTFICLRFRRKANPVPSKTTHNAKLEVVWTTIPILILVAIAIPSLRLHFYMTKVPEAELTIKAVGYQWYWHYQYPDQGGFEFDSYMVKDNELKPGQPRLLTADNKLVVPVDTNVRVLLTGADVIHAFAMPALGVKRDAIPGRLNETWFKASRTGTYYGQCSELCGVGHGFMPIELEVLSKEDFAKWSAGKRQAAGIKEPAATQQAQAKTTKHTATE